MKKFTKTALLIFIFAGITGIFGYLLRILLARNLSIAEYGLFYAVYSLVFFFASFKDLGLGEATVYFINKYLAKNNEEKIKSLFLVQLITQISLGLIIGAIFFIFKGFLVTNYFKDPHSDFILSIIIILFILDSIMPAILNIFTAHQELEVSNIMAAIKMGTILAGTYILFSFDFTGYKIAPMAYLLGSIITSIAISLLFFIRFHKIISSKISVDKDLIKEVFNYAIPIGFATAGGVILIYSDTIILTMIRGTESVGLYNVALPVINLILFFITPMIAIIFPKISNLHHNKKHEEINKFVTQIYNNFLIFTLPLALAFAAYPKLIIMVLFGAKYLAAENTLRVFSLCFVFMTLRTINFSIISGIGKAKDMPKIVYIGAITNIILDIILIMKFGPAGAAIATGIGYLIMSYMTTKIIKKEYPLKIDYLLITKTIFCGIGFILSVTALKYLINVSNPIIEAMIVVGISSLVYLGLLFITKVLTVEKINAAKRALF